MNEMDAKEPKTYTVVAHFDVTARTVDEAISIVENYKDDPDAITDVQVMDVLAPKGA